MPYSMDDYIKQYNSRTGSNLSAPTHKVGVNDFFSNLAYQNTGQTPSADGNVYVGYDKRTGQPVYSNQVDQAQANAGAYSDATGVQLGSRANDATYMNSSALRGDQSVAERALEQRGDYLYGGSVTGAQDAIDAARSNMNPYTSGLQNYSGQYNTEMGNAAGRQADGSAAYLKSDQTGQQGIYGNAAALTQLANQGQGPSLAQAQLNANTGAAMRQQLAMAGSGRGAGGGASAYRNAAMNQAQIQGQANANAMAGQIQEANDYRNFQANALGQAGNLYATGRQGDMSGVGASQAQQQLNDQYAMGMGGLANDSMYNAGGLQQGTENLANQVNMNALTGNMGYESNLSNIYGINKGNQQPDSGMNPFVAAGINAASNFATYGAASAFDRSKDK